MEIQGRQIGGAAVIGERVPTYPAPVGYRSVHWNGMNMSFAARANRDQGPQQASEDARKGLFDDRRQHLRGPVSGLANARKASTGMDWVPLVRSCSGVPVTVPPVQPLNAR
jgi:hypothetical protein